VKSFFVEIENFVKIQYDKDAGKRKNECRLCAPEASERQQPDETCGAPHKEDFS